MLENRTISDRIGVTLKYLTVSGLAFQAVHFIEHLAQVGYWLARPLEAPWLTPWAVAGRDQLAVGGDAVLGNEILHLVGNLVFLAGLGAFHLYCQRQTLETPPALRVATIIQSLHVAEHIALTATAVIWGKAIGVSTFLGLVDGPVLTSYRVWFHFLINLAATWAAAKALISSLYDRKLQKPNPARKPTVTSIQSRPLPTGSQDMQPNASPTRPPKQ